MTFSNADRGFKTLSANKSKNAFLTALRDGDLVISGNFVGVLWLQGLTEYMQPARSGALDRTAVAFVRWKAPERRRRYRAIRSARIWLGEAVCRDGRHQWPPASIERPKAAAVVESTCH